MAKIRKAAPSAKKQMELLFFLPTFPILNPWASFSVQRPLPSLQWSFIFFRLFAYHTPTFNKGINIPKENLFMSKKINGTFRMSGTYYLNERSVLAARNAAMDTLPLPEDRDYVDDSLILDEMDECMATNGWGYDEIDDLSRLSSESLTTMIDYRIRNGLETIPGTLHTTTRLIEFLLDYYDIEYTSSQKSTAQSAQADPYIEKACYIVIRSNHDGEKDACAFDSEEIARQSVGKDIEMVKKDLSDRGYQFNTVVKSDNEIEIASLDGDFRYEWQIVQSTIIAKT